MRIDSSSRRRCTVHASAESANSVPFFAPVTEGQALARCPTFRFCWDSICCEARALPRDAVAKPAGDSSTVYAGSDEGLGVRCRTQNFQQRHGWPGSVRGMGGVKLLSSHHIQQTYYLTFKEHLSPAPRSVQSAAAPVFLLPVHCSADFCESTSRPQMDASLLRLLLVRTPENRTRS